MRLSGHFVAVATLGFLVIVRVVLFNADAFTRGSRTFSNVTPVHGPVVDGGLGAASSSTSCGGSSARRTAATCSPSARIGSAAQAIGIRVMDPRLLAFVVGAFFSAVAGSLYAHFITSFSPTVFYFDLTFRVITMLVIGGMGSVSGSILGAILIVGLGEALRRVEDATLLYGLSSIVLAVIFIVVITVRRDGLLGQREVPLDRLFDPAWWRRRRGRPARRTAAPRGRSEPVDALRVAPQDPLGPVERRPLVDGAVGDVLVEDPASARRPSRAPTQYSSGTSEASVLNRILLAGARPSSSRVISVASPAANRIASPMSA